MQGCNRCKDSPSKGATLHRFKVTFFQSGWARYDTARPDILGLMPSEARIKDLRTDYRAMAFMMFDETPSFSDDILGKIEKLHETING